MIVYQINKKDLDEKDFRNVRNIRYSGDNLIIVQILPREHPGEERKKIVISSPASETNWQLFRRIYFQNSINSNI